VWNNGTEFLNSPEIIALVYLIRKNFNSTSVYIMFGLRNNREGIVNSGINVQNSLAM
jgi:hypothetical protein